MTERSHVVRWCHHDGVMPSLVKTGRAFVILLSRLGQAGLAGLGIRLQLTWA